LARVFGLGIAQHDKLVRLLRTTGLYAPLRVLHDRPGGAENRRRWREARQFRRREGRILRGVAGDGSGRKVLFAASSTPGLYRIRVEAMLAKALEQRGCRPVFVTDRHDIWHEEHLRSFGFREFVFFDDYAPPRAAIERRAGELLAGCATLRDVLALTEDGHGVGFHAASRALNRLRRGSLDPRHPDVAGELLLALTNSLVSAAAVDRIIEDVAPDTFVGTAQNLTPWAEFYESALRHGIDTLYWMPSQLEEALLLRRYTYEDRHEHFFTLAGDTWERVRQMPWTSSDGDEFLASLRESYVTANWFHRKKTLRNKRVKDRDEIVANLGLDPAKKTAFVFSHVLYDATFWFGENLFADYADWLVETVKAAAKNTNVNWVIKLHPENVRRWEETTGRYDLENLEEYQLIKGLFPELPPHIKLMTPENDTNTLSLFEFADYALTVRGTIGLEFPCFGVPTLTAGTGGYSGRGFTIDSSSAADYLERLAHIEDIPRMDDEQIAVAQRFSHGVFHMKPVPFTSFETHLLPDDEWDRGWNAHTFALNVSSSAELARAEDLAWFAEWALESTQCDLLSRDAEARLGEAAEASAERALASPR
jgi:hypothetical protein